MSAASTLAGMRTTVYGPGCSRRDPLTLAEATQVNTWRARGLGWDACAKMVGRSTPDVRAHCDAGYQRPYEPARPVIEAVKARPAAKAKPASASARDPRLTRPRRLVLEALVAGCHTAHEVGAHVSSGGGMPAAQAGNILNKLEGLGWAAKTGGSWKTRFDWAATEAGLKALAEGAARG